MEDLFWRLLQIIEVEQYREVYTVKYKEVLYVLHIFQKKSKRDIETPKQDIELIKNRLKRAEMDYKEHYGKKKNKN